jgi:hypothetical protein
VKTSATADWLATKGDAKLAAMMARLVALAKLADQIPWLATKGDAKLADEPAGHAA